MEIKKVISVSRKFPNYMFILCTLETIVVETGIGEREREREGGTIPVAKTEITNYLF